MAIANIYDYHLGVVDDELVRHLESLPEDFWDFVEYEKKYTHFIHTYPAMMIPPIPENILKIMKTYQPNIRTMLDPFAGSGTSLLEGVLAGLDVVGLDLNPLALVLSKTKCTPINPEKLERISKVVLENIENDINNENQTKRAV
jgi:site-specific DNA-methyltransferase (cytosine-N4-specific)